MVSLLRSIEQQTYCLNRTVTPILGFRLTDQICANSTMPEARPGCPAALVTGFLCKTNSVDWRM